MARRASKTGTPGKPPEQLPAEPGSGLVLRRSPARLRLEVLEIEHERLLREIEKKRYACQTTEFKLREAHERLWAQTGPLRARMLSVLGQIHEIFDRLLAPRSRLGSRERARLARFHRQMIEDLPRPHEDGGAQDGADAAAEQKGSQHSPPFENAPFEDAGFGAPDEAEHASAAKPSGKHTELLRSLYKKLAVALHPDRSRDASETERLTSLMKEVTLAYANEDLAKLVELDRTWLAQTSSDADEDVERRSASLLQANTELRRQLRGLAERLKQIKSSWPEGAAPRGRRASSSVALADQLSAELEGDVTNLELLRDAAQKLLEGRISLDEFLSGPSSARDYEVDAGEPLDEVFQAMLEEIFAAAQRERPAGSQESRSHESRSQTARRKSRRR